MTTGTPTRVGVIGAGPGGYACAYRAADLGCSVTLIDSAPNPGGVCTYRGCIPSKALLHLAKLLTEAREAEAFGISFGEPSIDLDAVRRWKDSVVTKLTQGNGSIARARKVAYVRGEATLIGGTRVSVESETGRQELAFDRLVLATGSRPAALPGVQVTGTRVWDSTSALELPFIPKTLLVIGGGYIGLELATVYSALGTKVTVVEATEHLLAGADRDLVDVLEKRLASTLHAVHRKTLVRSVVERERDVEVILAAAGTETSASFDAVLVSIGRRPNSQVPGIDRTGVSIGPNGFVLVDEQRRTTNPLIFAIGDVAGEPTLAHKAVHEGCVAAEVIAGERVRFERRAIPAVVFTDPEIAWCGWTEAQAVAAKRAVEVARFPWAASGRAVTLGAPYGVTKLVVDAASGRVIGAGIAGVGAGELIAEAVLAIEMGATVKELALAIHPHPTLSETVMEAAEVWSGQATHVFRPRPRVAV